MATKRFGAGARSPDRSSTGKPVVTVNGKQAFSGMVKRDAATLMRWASRDDDRTALYGAELRIEARTP